MQERKDFSEFQRATREVAVASVAAFSTLFGAFALADQECSNAVRALSLTPAAGYLAALGLAQLRRIWFASRTNRVGSSTSNLAKQV